MRMSSRPLVLGALDDAVREWSLEELGENRQHMENHERFRSFKLRVILTCDAFFGGVDFDADGAG